MDKLVCLLFLIFISSSLPLTSDLASSIKAKLKQAGLGGRIGQDRMMSVGSGLSGLVAGGFDRLGYIPVAEAAQMCEGQARWRVEEEIDKLRQEGAVQFGAVSSDLEARCRSYVEYAAGECVARVNSLAEELERQGRSLLGNVQESCMRETLQLVERTTEEEERRLGDLGKREEVRLRKVYEDEGKVEEIKVVADFEKRGKQLEQKIRKEYELRGKEEEDKARREFELRGELERVSIELELRKRGEKQALTIRKEFEDRGALLEGTIRKEFEERGEEEMKTIEAEFRARGRKLQTRGEEQCTEMISMACEDVVEESESGEFCEEFLFFTGDLEERKRRKRLGLSLLSVQLEQP